MKKLMLEIGHGGTDTGAVANDLVEKNINLIVGKRIRDIMVDYEVEVQMSREEDITLSPDERVKIVTDFNPDLCVSIHHNAATATSARGAEVIHAHFDAYDDALATDILLNMAKIGMPTRRAFTRLNERGTDYYYMIRRIWDNDTDAIITEGGFLTNTEDAKMLTDMNFLYREADAIAKAIIKYMKLELKPKNPVHELITIGLIEEDHALDSNVNWKEFAEILVKVLR